jgi:uncharacterized protein
MPAALAVVMVLALALVGGGMAGSTPARAAAAQAESLAPLDPVPQTAPALVGAPDAPTPAQVQQYVGFVIGDLRTDWARWFRSAGFATAPNPTAHIVAPGRTFTSSCVDGTGRRPVVTADYPNLFYCSSDGPGGGLALPVLTMRRMWSGDIVGRRSRVAGDFAAGVAVAHEFGHAVMDRLEVARGAAPPRGKNNELIADCLAGVWTQWANKEGILAPGDFQEGVAALEAVGDRSVTLSSHGTPSERGTAVTAGFRAGDPQTCIGTYWR